MWKIVIEIPSIWDIVVIIISVSPENIMSNTARWLEFIGFKRLPRFLQHRSIDDWGIYGCVAGFSFSLARYEFTSASQVVSWALSAIIIILCIRHKLRKDAEQLKPQSLEVRQKMIFDEFNEEITKLKNDVVVYMDMRNKEKR